MREGKANWFVLVTIFLLWLYNTGRLDSLYNIVLNPNKIYTPPLSNTPTPAIHQDKQQGGGGNFWGDLFGKVLMFEATGGAGAG